jgi:hypothetical protein
LGASLEANQMTAIAIALVFVGGFAVGVLFSISLDLWLNAPVSEDTSSGLPVSPPVWQSTKTITVQPEPPPDENIEAMVKFYSEHHNQDVANN